MKRVKSRSIEKRLKTDAVSSLTTLVDSFLSVQRINDEGRLTVIFQLADSLQGQFPINELSSLTQPLAAANPDLTGFNPTGQEWHRQIDRGRVFSGGNADFGALIFLMLLSFCKG